MKREMQMKAAVRCHCTPSKMGGTASLGENGKQWPSQTLVFNSRKTTFGKVTLLTKAEHVCTQ